MRCFHDKQGPEGALTGGNMDLQWRTPGVLKESLLRNFTKRFHDRGALVPEWNPEWNSTGAIPQSQKMDSHQLFAW